MSKHISENLEGMKIIRPTHNKPASVVPNWRFIKNEARRLKLFIKTAKFEGDYQKAFSLAHSEVSLEPLNFFVINEDASDSKLIKELGSWCIINPKIIAFSDPVYWKEACMSFPYRKPKNTDRMNEITAEYYIPFLWTWRKVRKKLVGLPAFLIQHNIEHLTGQSIYFKK